MAVTPRSIPRLWRESWLVLVILGAWRRFCKDVIRWNVLYIWGEAMHRQPGGHVASHATRTVAKPSGRSAAQQYAEIFMRNSSWRK
jgi:hypothetical protein